MNIRNLTPHALHLYGAANSSQESTVILTVEPETKEGFRLQETHENLEVEGFDYPLSKITYKEGANPLPKEEEGTFLFVSLPVAQAFRDRDDIIIPTNTVRDDAGRIIGCRGFARI